MHLKRILHDISIPFRVFGKQKIFGIGHNKTGTTSLAAALEEMGFIVAPQISATSVILKEWSERRFDSLYKFCKYRGQAFQDYPFSLPFTFIALDQMFPGSKFILTVRDSKEQWYRSLTRFEGRRWARDGRSLPSKEDLECAEPSAWEKKNNTFYSEIKRIIYYGMPKRYWKSGDGDWLQIRKMIYNSPENEPYKKEFLTKIYELHNTMVREYFRVRPDDLLEINIAEKDSYKKLKDFLTVNNEKTEFPWKNRTDER